VLAFPTANIERAQFSQGLAVDFSVPAARALRAVVVNDNQFSIFGKLDIYFDGVGVLPPGELDRSERVFGRVTRRAPMGDDFHAFFSPHDEGA